jgi:excisionase family DNA binding protein
VTQPIHTAVKPLNSVNDSRALLGGIGRTKIYELIQQKKLKLVKVGRRSMITGESIAAVAEGGAV